MRKRQLQYFFIILFHIGSPMVWSVKSQDIKQFLDSARKYASNGDTLEVYYLSKAIELKPKDATLYELRAYAHTFTNQSAEKKLKSAIDDLSSALKISPGNALYYQQRGFYNFKYGLRKDALKDLDMALKINPKNPLAYRIRGDVHWDRINYLSALMDYRNCARLDSSLYCQRKLADCHYTLYNFTRASELYNYIIKTYGHDTLKYNEDLLLSYIYLGHSDFNHGKISQAIKSYDKAIWYNDRFEGPTDLLMETFRFRGLAKIQLGKPEEGCEDLQVAKRLGDENAAGFINSFCPEVSK